MQASTRCRPAAPAGNTATGWLKLIALGFMFMDHAGKMLLPSVPEMRVVGRIAFPIYVWCMIVGFHYTRSVPKYLLRILLIGLISQPLYYLALHHEYPLGEQFTALFQHFSLKEWLQFHQMLFAKPNIFLTLFLGLSALWGIREKKAGSHIWMPVLAVFTAVILNADYGWKGVLLFILLYAVQESRRRIAAVMVAYFLFWGASYSVTKSLFGIPVNLNALPEFLSQPLSAFLRLETYALFSLPLILIPFRTNLKMPRWLGYALYPAHLVLLILLEKIILK